MWAGSSEDSEQWRTFVGTVTKFWVLDWMTGFINTLHPQLGTTRI
jgi:hypothetical protein